ncbi:hypothetical protein INR49_015602 [Caranx melampygus]|nr:hypothetical protein INR49_015602 [Caranx melampygus]
MLDHPSAASLFEEDSSCVRLILVRRVWSQLWRREEEGWDGSEGGQLENHLKGEIVLSHTRESSREFVIRKKERGTTELQVELRQYEHLNKSTRWLSYLSAARRNVYGPDWILLLHDCSSFTSPLLRYIVNTGCKLCPSGVCLTDVFAVDVHGSVPDLKETVPGPSAHRHAVIRHTQTAHTIVMAGQDSCRRDEHKQKRPYTSYCFILSAPPTCSVPLHGVPDVAVEVIVTSQQQAARAGESHGGDTTDDVVMAVEAELLVGS